MRLKISIAAACIVAIIAAFAFGLYLAQGTAQDTPSPNAQTVALGASGPTPQPLIVTIDRSRLLMNSAAGQDIARQMQAFKETLAKEFLPEKEKLENEAKQLRDQAAVLDAKVREQRQQALQKRGEALTKRFTERQTEIQAGMQAAQRQVIEVVDPILREVMLERGANILLDRQAVVTVAGIDIDVTNAVIQRLDERLPSVKVEPVKADAAEGSDQPNGAGQ